MEKVSVAVLGASGYAGAEFLRLAATHPVFEVTVAGAHSNAGAAIAEQYPGLGHAYADQHFVPLDDASVAEAEIVVLGLPHGESQTLVPTLMDTAKHIVDLGADFRLSAALYEQWYGHPHAAPQHIEQFSYGLVEFRREEILARPHIAAPGCYPTATSLATLPAIQAGCCEPFLTVNALSGTTGAGRGTKVEMLFGEMNENARAYGGVNHRHTGEIQNVLSAASSSPVSVLFTPHLIPTSRGILVTATAQASNPTSTAALLEIYRDAYANEEAVIVLDTPPMTKATLGANIAHVSVAYSERTNTVVMMSAIDNLTKGTAGQAIQALNLKYGLPESTGLSTVGLVP